VQPTLGAVDSLSAWLAIPPLRSDPACPRPACRSSPSAWASSSAGWCCFSPEPSGLGIGPLSLYVAGWTGIKLSLSLAMVLTTI
jgi:hypothetical protein